MATRNQDSGVKPLGAVTACYAASDIVYQKFTPIQQRAPEGVFILRYFQGSIHTAVNAAKQCWTRDHPDKHPMTALMTRHSSFFGIKYRL